MSKQAFDVEGDFQMGRVRQHFKVQVPAADEEQAKEYTYADLGSRHGVARRQIEITSVVVATEVNPTTAKRLE